jgi:hypothetical protein
VALGLSGGAPPDRSDVADAVLDLLTTRARTAPVLVVVDDLQWLDRPSAGVLAVVARRLAGTRVGLLAAHRAGEPGFFDGTGLPQHAIAPLDAASAAELVQSSSPQIAPAVLRRVLAVAEGNPLALVELPHALAAPQLQGTVSLPSVLPLGPRLERLFAARVEALAAPARALLLLASLDATGSLGVLRAAGGDPVDDLAARGGVRPRDRRPRGRTSALPARRRPHHRGAAVRDGWPSGSGRTPSWRRVTSEPERAAWHRAAGRRGPRRDGRGAAGDRRPPAAGPRRRDGGRHTRCSGRRR